MNSMEVLSVEVLSVGSLLGRSKIIAGCTGWYWKLHVLALINTVLSSVVMP